MWAPRLPHGLIDARPAHPAGTVRPPDLARDAFDELLRHEAPEARVVRVVAIIAEDVVAVGRHGHASRRVQPGVAIEDDAVAAPVERLVPRLAFARLPAPGVDDVLIRARRVDVHARHRLVVHEELIVAYLDGV